MTNVELARLQLLRRNIASVIKDVVRKCLRELRDINSSNYIAKNYVIISSIDSYLHHLELLKGVTSTEIDHLEAEKRRWEGLQDRIRILEPEEVNSFKVEMERLLTQLSLELSLLDSQLDTEIKKVKRQQSNGSNAA